MRYAALLLPILAGCPELGKTCTLIYAPDNLTVSFDTEALAPGAYTVTVSGDVEATCTLTLPSEVEGVCDLEGLSLSTNEAGDGLGELFFFDMGPEALTVSITLDGAEIASESFSPSYTVDEPNGEGCGERRSGIVMMSVD